MGVVARIGAHKAMLRDGEWRSADAALEERLNAETRQWFEQTGGPKLNSADPEAELARETLRRVGGTVQLRVPARSERARRIYFERRQMRLDFMGSAGG